MKKYLNRFLASVYYIFLIIPVCFITVSVYSYFAVLNKFGEVPPYADGVKALEEAKANTAKIFPIEYGDMLLSILLYAIVILPFFIILNYLFHRKYSWLTFYPKFILFLFAEYLISFFLLASPNPVGWYTGYIFD